MKVLRLPRTLAALVEDDGHALIGSSASNEPQRRNHNDA
jgi:hypothetical protein